MKKVLFVATVVKKHINTFHLPYLKWFKDNGYEVHVCAKNDFYDVNEITISHCDYYYDVPFERSPLKLSNLCAYRKLKKIIKNNDFDIIHCHTPMGGVLTRLAAKSNRNSGTKILYTAHGFHFFKGSSLKNWILYYPIEKYLSRYTDGLITINEEDYLIAKKKFNSPLISHVNGVGIDFNKFTPQTVEIKKRMRKEYKYSENDFILIYVGELSYRKHQDLIINAISLLDNKVSNIKLLLLGDGECLEEYKEQVSLLGIDEKVQFLGFRHDVSKLMLMADIAVSSSRQEGLPVNVMEAMATGLPLLVTDCRGNRDLVTDGENGYVLDIDNVEAFTQAIEKLYYEPHKRKQFGENSLKKVQSYSLDNVVDEMEEIYLKFL